MNYREIFESNNVDLQTILNKVNELPEASGDSGDYVVGTATLDDEGNLTIPELIGKSRFIVVRESVTMMSGAITGGMAGFVDTLYCLDGSSITAKTCRVSSVELYQNGPITYDNTTGAFSNDGGFAYATFEDTNYIYIAW